MSQRERTLDALRWVLRPVIRLFIAHGIQLPAVTAALKQVYVDVATTDFRIDDKAPTDSRISVLTGVHRRDVRSIRTDGAPSSARPAVSLSATVVGRWLGDPTYIDKEGRPLDLHRLDYEGEPSFEALFHGISKDVHPRTVLDDLINQQLVEWDEEADIVRLKSRAFVPMAGGDDMMRFFETNLHDHLAAAVANLLDGDKQGRFLERAVFYNKLAPKSVDSIEVEARKLGEQVLNDLNSKALRHQKSDDDDDAAKERFRFGIFFYREEDGSTGESS